MLVALPAPTTPPGASSGRGICAELMDGRTSYCAGTIRTVTRSTPWS